MRSVLLSLCLTLLSAVSANASPDTGSDYALILSRQAPGTPQYECHFNCGNALAGGRNPAHCDNSTWVDYYEACLECALDFDIWTIYGNGVSSAASACGLSATPSPSGDSESGPSSTSDSGSSETVAPSSTSGSDSSGTSAAGSIIPTTEASETQTSAGPATTAPPSTESGADSTPAPTSSVSTAGASGFAVHASGPLLSAVAFASTFLGLMGAW